QPLALLDLLSPDERHQLLMAAHGPQLPFADHHTPAQLFEMQAVRTPDAVAVVSVNQQISYGALDMRANQLASYLRSLGVGPETRVALCLDRSPLIALCIFAVWKAGAAYVPLDPSYPAARLEYLLRDSQATVLLIDAHLQHVVPAPTATTVLLDAVWPLIEQQPPTALACSIHPLNAAYFIYTSGSTGVPK